MDPSVWAVAGCLFEVSLPVDSLSRWRCIDPGPEVTLLSEDVRGSGQHFRFRAESPAALAGAELRFGCDGRERLVHVLVAPERLT
jgi:hypothetical protein